MPFATHGRTQCGINHPFHDYDNEVFANLAVAALAKRGRKRIAHLIPPPGLLFHLHAITGFANALREFGLSEFLANNLNIDTNIAEVLRFGTDVAQLNDAPDGYVSYSELSTMAIITGLEAAGKTLGRDFDIVTKQCSPFMSWFRPGLMMINEDHKLAGRELAKAVLGAIKGEDVKSLQSLVAPFHVVE